MVLYWIYLRNPDEVGRPKEANLKAWLEHGILLHEKEADLRGDPLAGFQFVNI